MGEAAARRANATTDPGHDGGQRGGQSGRAARPGETHEGTRPYMKGAGAAILDGAIRAWLTSRPMAAPTGLRSPSRLRCGLALLALATACSTRVTSESIAEWKTTQKGPERLHEALADHGVPAKLRAEAAVALVDIGRDEEVDQILASAPADDRAEIAKALEPLYEVAMKDPSPEKSLAYRDALFSLRGVAPSEYQKRIDEALLAVAEGRDEGRQAAPGAPLGRQDADRDRRGLGRDAGRGSLDARGAVPSGGRDAGQGGRRADARQGRRGADRARAADSRRRKITREAGPRRRRHRRTRPR